MLCECLSLAVSCLKSDWLLPDLLPRLRLPRSYIWPALVQHTFVCSWSPLWNFTLCPTNMPPIHRACLISSFISSDKSAVSLYVWIFFSVLCIILQLTSQWAGSSFTVQCGPPSQLGSAALRSLTWQASGSVLVGCCAHVTWVDTCHVICCKSTYTPWLKTSYPFIASPWISLNYYSFSKQKKCVIKEEATKNARGTQFHWIMFQAETQMGKGGSLGQRSAREGTAKWMF